MQEANPAKKGKDDDGGGGSKKFRSSLWSYDSYPTVDTKNDLPIAFATAGGPMGKAQVRESKRISSSSSSS